MDNIVCFLRKPVCLMKVLNLRDFRSKGIYSYGVYITVALKDQIGTDYKDLLRRKEN